MGRLGYSIIASLTTCVASLLGISSAFSADETKLLPINYGGPTAGYYNVYVAENLGLFKKYGLEPKFYWFTSGQPLLAALRSESLDVISTGSAIVFALEQNIPMKIIAWEIDNAQGEALIAAKDSKLSSWKDLPKAKAIGASSGTCAQVNVAQIAKKLGVKYRSLNVINIAPPLYRNAFESGSIDAAVGWAPHSLVLAAAGYKVLNWDPDYGGVCPSVVGGRPEFFKKHPDVGMKLALIQAEARAEIEKNPQLAIDSLMKVLSISEPIAKTFYERHCCGKMPTFQQQLAEDTPWSLTAKRAGLAGQIHLTSEMLYESGTSRAPLSWEAVEQAIDPTYLRQAVDKMLKN
jgi:NitT/TauT family transport system substrate-binding protein